MAHGLVLRGLWDKGLKGRGSMAFNSAVVKSPQGSYTKLLRSMRSVASGLHTPPAPQWITKIRHHPKYLLLVEL